MSRAIEVDFEKEECLDDLANAVLKAVEGHSPETQEDCLKKVSNIFVGKGGRYLKLPTPTTYEIRKDSRIIILKFGKLTGFDLFEYIDCGQSRDERTKKTGTMMRISSRWDREEGHPLYAIVPNISSIAMNSDMIAYIRETMPSKEITTLKILHEFAESEPKIGTFVGTKTNPID